MGRRIFFEANCLSTYHQTCELVGFVMYLKQGWIMQIRILVNKYGQKKSSNILYAIQFEQQHLDDVRPAEVIITSGRSERIMIISFVQ